MDVATTVTGVFGLMKSAKDALEIAQKLGNQDLRQIIVDIREQSLQLQEELLDLRKQVVDLRIENEKLKKAHEEKPNMRLGNSHFWEINEKEVSGPYCVTCWENEKKKMRMIGVARSAFIMCPKCNHPIDGHIPPSDWGLIWKK